MLFLTLAALAVPASASYLEELQADSRRLGLGRERYWTLLLHVAPTLSGRRSEEVQDDFFLSDRGRRDPQAELEADLAGFARGEEPDPDEHPQCRYPARWAWLKAKLAIDPAKLPERDCPKYAAWRDEVRIGSVSLVFASAYLDNPSSMYGHTFLRLDRAGPGPRRPLLDYAVNYAANAGTDNGVLFAVYGLIGAFPGTFSAMPYYLKVQEYSNLESRDLWEYPLSLSPAAIERLSAHLFELDRASFRYFFFNRNCSYQLLPLLDTAEPSLELSGAWPLAVIPADSVRAILSRPGLAGPPRLRPSRSTVMLARRRILTESERDLAGRLGRDGEGWADLAALESGRRARVLDSAADYLDFLVDYRKDREGKSQALKDRLLSERSKLIMPGPDALGYPDASPPEAGHRSSRLGLALGGGDGERYAELELRAALHDPLDRRAGYIPYSGLEMFGFRLRRDFRSSKTYLEEAVLARILSITPWDPWVRKPSWRFEAALKTYPGLGRDRWNALGAGATLGSGLALEGGLFGREAGYARADLEGAAGGVFRGGGRLGGGLGSGLLWEPAPSLRLGGSASYHAYALGDRRPELRLDLQASLDLGRDRALRLRLEKVRAEREAQFALQLYF